MKHCGVPEARIGSSLPQSSRKRLCQLPAGNPVAALTVHRTVIHYRDDASLTLVRGSRVRESAAEKANGGKVEYEGGNSMVALAIILAILYIPIGVIFELTKKHM